MSSKSVASDHHSDSNRDDDPTQWSLFQRFKKGTTEQSREARAQIAETYSHVLLEMSRRLKWNLDDATARDCVQSFLEKRILSGTLLEQADPAKGRFRTFLFVSFRNFVTDHMRSTMRNPVAFSQSLLPDGSPPGTELTDADSQHLEVAWAREVLQRVIVRMREECQLSLQMRVWNVFEGRLLRPVTEMAEPVSYETLVDQCGFGSIKEAANSLTTAKRIFRRVSRQVLEDFSGGYDSDEELQSLRSVFASGVSLVARPDPIGTPELASQRSWILAKALELPPHEPFWTPDQLNAAARELLSQQLSQVLSQSIAKPGDNESTSATLGEFLQSRPRPLAVLSQLKDWAKQEFTSGEAGFPPAVISAVYFTVLLSSKADHDHRLSRLTDDAMQISIDALTESEWLPEELRVTLSAMGS
jgi:hypothetical protein